MVLLRENSQFWLRKVSMSLVPPLPRSRTASADDDLNGPPKRQMSQVRDTDSSRRASITITIITIAFIISYGPYMILWVYSLVTFELELVRPLIDHTHSYWHVYLYIYQISTNLLSTFNSSIFPLIYFVRIKGRMFRRVWSGMKRRWTRVRTESSYHRYFQIEQLQREKVASNGASPV